MCTSTRSAGSAAGASEDSSPVYFAATPEANMTPDQPWIFRTYAGYATPRQTNERFKANLAKGQTGLSVAFDLPTQCGYDADDPMSKGEVGRVPVPVDATDHGPGHLDVPRGAEMEPHQRVLVPPPGGRRRAGAGSGVHDGQR